MTALTVGVFDLLHWGHFELFRRAKELVGDSGLLTVAIQKDSVVTKYKPQTKLAYTWEMRAKMISALRYVDKVIPYTDIDESIKYVDFDIFAVGADQMHAGFKRAEQWCIENGKTVIRMPRTEGICSSDLRGGGGGMNLQNELFSKRATFLEGEIRDGVAISTERKKAWKVMLDILEELIRICEKYGLEWSMDGGSLIGAMRHKGFVPWDDDIDIVLPRDHYEKLLRILPTELPHHLFLQTADTDGEYFAGHAKVRDSRTAGIMLFHAYAGHRFNMGLFVDVLPLDAVPEDAKERERLGQRGIWLKDLKRDVFWRQYRDGSLRGFVHWLKCCAIYGFIGGRYGYNRFREQVFRRMDVRTSKEWQVHPNQVGYVARCRRKAEWFKDYIWVPFEYLMVKVPSDYDKILTQNYGDWQKPSRKGSQHGELVMDADRDYKTVLADRFGKVREFHLFKSLVRNIVTFAKRRWSRIIC